MELIFGRTLKDYTSGALLSITETLDIAVQIVNALDAAYEKGVIHRDVKPENVIITTRGLVKVLDFGLAKIQSLSNLTILTSLEALTASDSYTRQLDAEVKIDFENIGGATEQRGQ
jgi:eukaryotic-like serine/threonine-protein kinase